MENKLSHVDQSGAARMVDVSTKDVTFREASASARILMNSEALNAIRENALKKGDAIAVARVAGILAAKKTDELIPLCHTLPLESVSLDFVIDDDGVLITSSAKTESKTGVEMEALTACTVAALALYDMAKAIDRGMIISDVKLLAKAGGRSGDFHLREAD